MEIIFDIYMKNKEMRYDAIIVSPRRLNAKLKPISYVTISDSFDQTTFEYGTNVILNVMGTCIRQVLEYIINRDYVYDNIKFKYYNGLTEYATMFMSVKNVRKLNLDDTVRNTYIDIFNLTKSNACKDISISPKRTGYKHKKLTKLKKSKIDSLTVHIEYKHIKSAILNKQKTEQQPVLEEVVTSKQTTVTETKDKTKIYNIRDAPDIRAG